MYIIYLCHCICPKTEREEKFLVKWSLSAFLVCTFYAETNFLSNFGCTQKLLSIFEIVEKQMIVLL